MDPAGFVVRVSAPGGPPHALRVAGPTCLVGRSRAAEVRLPAPEVSGAHLRLARRPDGLVVEDLGSANGSTLDGVPLPPGVLRPLPPEASLRVGPYVLTATAAEATPGAPPPLEGTATLAARLLADLVAAGAAPPAILEITTPDGVRHRAVLTAERPFLIGRDAGCDVGAGDPDLSRRHLEIRLGPAGAVATDLGSKNGTWRGEARLGGPCPLASGDALRLGGTTLRFEDPAVAWLEAIDGEADLREAPPGEARAPAAGPGAPTPPAATAGTAEDAAPVPAPPTTAAPLPRHTPAKGLSPAGWALFGLAVAIFAAAVWALRQVFL